MTNGNLYQFAWVTVLEPSFPVLHVTTGVLAASVHETRKQLAHQLACVKTFCQGIAEKITDPSLIPEARKSPIELGKISSQTSQ